MLLKKKQGKRFDITIAQMLDFAARHDILPQVEEFPIEQVNEAIQHLRDGKARYRVVLKVGDSGR